MDSAPLSIGVALLGGVGFLSLAMMSYTSPDLIGGSGAAAEAGAAGSGIGVKSGFGSLFKRGDAAADAAKPPPRESLLDRLKNRTGAFLHKDDDKTVPDAADAEASEGQGRRPYYGPDGTVATSPKAPPLGIKEGSKPLAGLLRALRRAPPILGPADKPSAPPVLSLGVKPDEVRRAGSEATPVWTGMQALFRALR